MPKKKTHGEFIDELGAVNSGIEILGAYVNSQTPIRARCKNCEHEWFPKPNNLLQGKGCPVCRRALAAQKRRRSEDELRRRMRDANPSIELLSDYVTAHDKVRCRCGECGHEWEALGNNLWRGAGCPNCKGKRKLSIEDLRRRLKSISPYIEVHGDYVNNKTAVDCVCLHCGNRWKSRPDNLLSGKGCPNCVAGATSYMQEFLRLAFSLRLGAEEVLPRDVAAIGKELDIYIPRLALAIEPGSWHWHKNKVGEDDLKRTLCEKQGITLITIYDGCGDEAEDLAREHRIVFRNNLGSHAKDELRGLANDLLALAGLPAIESEDAWSDVEARAARLSRARTTEEFIELMRGVSSDVEITGSYVSSYEKISCQCLACGHVWNATPHNLLRGRGCPACRREKIASKLRKTQEQYENEVLLRHPFVRVVGEYRGVKEKIDLECLECGCCWTSVAERLLRGIGCPECAKKRTRSGARY